MYKKMFLDLFDIFYTVMDDIELIKKKKLNRNWYLGIKKQNVESSKNG